MIFLLHLKKYGAILQELHDKIVLTTTKELDRWLETFVNIIKICIVYTSIVHMEPLLMKILDRNLKYLY